MRTRIAVLFLVASTAVSLWGQALPGARAPESKFELYGGFSRMRGDIGTEARANGWASALTVRLNPFIGFDIAANGSYAPSTYMGGRVSLHTAFVGPRLSFPTRIVTPFIHVGIGAARWNSVLGKETGFAKTGGLGFDVNLPRHLRYRLIQADYVKTPFREGQNAVFSTGLIYAW